MTAEFQIYNSFPHVERQAREAERKVDDLARDFDDLQRRFERLTLVAQAMWELLRDSAAHTEAQLLDRVQAIDQRDGRADGKVSRTVRVCAKCRRNSNSRHTHCIYCEAPLPATNVFEAR